jgi:hypothetical protein
MGFQNNHKLLMSKKYSALIALRVQITRQSMGACPRNDGRRSSSPNSGRPFEKGVKIFHFSVFSGVI